MKKELGLATRSKYLLNRSEAGFTLVEILVVISIIALTSVFLAINLSRARSDVSQTTNIFMSHVKNTQARAAASSKYENLIRCGYGIRYVDSNSYAIYVGPSAQAPNDCTTYNRNFGSGDADIDVITFSNNKIEFKSSFNDIFFEPPDPTTFINNSDSLNQAAEDIIFGVVGESCPGNCKTLYVYPSGKIE